MLLRVQTWECLLHKAGRLECLLGARARRALGWDAMLYPNAAHVSDEGSDTGKGG